MAFMSFLHKRNVVAEIAGCGRVIAGIKIAELVAFGGADENLRVRKWVA
jgi:hypothetical protein